MKFNKLIKNEYIDLRDSIILFNNRKGTTLSASCTFYFLLTLIPSLLVIIHLLSFLLGDLSSSSDYVFYILQKFFPQVAPDFLQKIQKMAWKILFQKNSLTFFNFFLLMASSLSFFNAVWNGLFLLSGNKKHNNYKRYLKGMGIISLTIGALALMIVIRPFIEIIIHFLQNNILFTYFWDSFESLRPFLLYFKSFNGNNLQVLLFFCFLLYFSIFYRVILQEKIPLKITLKSTIIFSLPLIIGKFAFAIYIDFAKKSMIQNYGSFYSLILALLWIYLLMNFFYFGAAYSLASYKNSLEKES